MNQRMLVLNVGLSGINKYLFSHLAKKGWDLEFVEVPVPKFVKRRAMISTFRPKLSSWKSKYAVKYSRLTKSPRAFRQRTEYCRREIEKRKGQFDIIFQISGMFAPFFENEKPDIPYVTFNDYTMSLAGKYPDWLPYPGHLKEWLRLEKELYRNAECIFATSENTKRSFIDDYGIAADKVHSVGYGLTMENLPAVSGNYDSRTILYVGIDFKRKGGYLLLDAFRDVKKEIEDAKLIIVGPNKDIFDIDMPGVEFLGALEDRETVKKLYERSSVFVMPSYCEPFGLVFLEAMAHKLPCIGTNIDAIPEIIDDGHTGYIVPAGEGKPLSDKIISLLKNPGLAREMGNNGFEKLNNKFQWELTCGVIDSRLKECLAKKTSGRDQI